VFLDSRYSIDWSYLLFTIVYLLLFFWLNYSCFKTVCEVIVHNVS